MPTPQILHAIAENIVNPLILLDDNSTQRLSKLKGQRLIVYVDELSWPIELAFEGSITLHQFGLNWLQASELDADNECRIKLSLSTLSELKDSRQITRLIREHKLDLEGDMHIAQRVSSLFQELNIDLEEVLSQKIGDVAAYQLVKTAKQAKVDVKKQLHMFSDTVAAALIDEKKLAAHKLQVMHYGDQVTEVRDAVERLNARVQRLENMTQAH